MFRQLLKALWKRKSRNLMLSLEILLAFVVVFAIAAASGRYYQLFRLPTGFSYDSVWSVQLQRPDQDGARNEADLYDKFKRGLLALPEVQQVAFANYSPYENSTWGTMFSLPDGGKSLPSLMMRVSDEFFATVGMSVQQGRSFSSADEGVAQQPVMINRRFADAMFPGQDAVGQVISNGPPGDKEQQLLKITGVFEDFRNRGEFMSPTHFALMRIAPNTDAMGVRTILIKVRPGTGRIFEARLSDRLKLIRNDLSYRISPLADLRQSMLSQSTTPLIVLSVIAGFLLLMVAFGLFGVLWQNTTRRIPEIGLRRATGATSLDIYFQIINEQLLLCSLAMSVGLLLLVQLPITGMLGENLNWPLFLMAALAAAAIMALLCVLCALYPAWRASRLSPTQALHYE